MTSFTYLNHTFSPVDTLPERADFFSTTRNCRSIGISNYNGGKYSHSEFYAKAVKAGCGKTDLFRIDGKTLVLPCQNELFEYTRKF